MNPEHWEMEFYEDAAGREPCKEFIEDLDLAKRLAIQAALVNILARQGPNVCETEFGKSLRHGLYEFRLRHSESEILARVRPDLAAKVERTAEGTNKILLRVFFHPYGDKILLLLGGYDKGKDPGKGRQAAEIRRARSMLRSWEEQQLEARRSGNSAVGVPWGRSFLTYWKKTRKGRDQPLT
jgi:hypothetical protein